MPRLLILLTLPKEVRDFYAARLAQNFPQLHIDVVDHYSKAPPFMPQADVLITFGPMMKDEVLRDANKLKWVQALGTGVDGSAGHVRLVRIDGDDRIRTLLLQFLNHRKHALEFFHFGNHLRNNGLLACG